MSNPLMSKKIWFLIAFVFLFLGSLVLSIVYYPFVFSRTVLGEVVGVERVLQGNMLVGTDLRTQSQVFSFAVAIQDKHGEIVTASSEDRQWAVVRKGQCAEAKYYPYPPWNLEKSGTYHDARLIKLLNQCPSSATSQPTH